MTYELQIIVDAVEKKIESAVNGKIDKIHDILEKQNERADAFEKKVDTHIAEVQPFIQAKAGLKVVRDFLIWASGGVLAWVALKSYLPFSWK